MDHESFIEEATIGGETIRLRHDQVPLEQVVLDEDNPRIRYRWGLRPGKAMDDVVLSFPAVKSLLKDIRQNGGLRERVIVQDTVDGHYKVVEGNCRTVVYRRLHKDDPEDDAWKELPVRILPQKVDQRVIAILLVDFHVAGKIEWDAHEKAGQVYYMSKRLSMEHAEIALLMRTSKSTVGRFYAAYELFNDTFLKIDNGKYKRKGEGNWSYFDEVYRRPVLKKRLKKDPKFGETFCRWVGDQRIGQPVNVRDLPAILDLPEALKVFMESKPDKAFDEAKAIVDANDPEIGSEFFRLLAKLRDMCTNAAQVREILRIRGDKVARRRLLETYDALVDFMRLADVEPTEAAPKKKSA